MLDEVDTTDLGRRQPRHRRRIYFSVSLFFFTFVVASFQFQRIQWEDKEEEEEEWRKNYSELQKLFSSNVFLLVVLFFIASQCGSVCVTWSSKYIQLQRVNTKNHRARINPKNNKHTHTHNRMTTKIDLYKMRTIVPLKLDLIHGRDKMWRRYIHMNTHEQRKTTHQNKTQNKSKPKQRNARQGTRLGNASQSQYKAN